MSDSVISVKDVEKEAGALRASPDAQIDPAPQEQAHKVNEPRRATHVRQNPCRCFLWVPTLHISKLRRAAAFNSFP